MALTMPRGFRRNNPEPVEFTEPQLETAIEVPESVEFTEPQLTEPVVVVPAEETATDENVENVTVTDVIEAPADTAADQPEQTTTKRGPRPSINVGDIKVRPSTRTDFRSRATKTETNPVYLAVKNAPLEQVTDILVENDDAKIKGALTMLRRAAQPDKLNLGMHIASKPYEIVEEDGVQYAVITFKTSAERQVRGRKSDGEAAPAEVESVE